MTEEKNVQQTIPLKLIHMNEIQATDTHWLWYPYIPYGKGCIEKYIQRAIDCNQQEIHDILTAYSLQLQTDI